MLTSISLFILGALLLTIGADRFVEGAAQLARYYQIPSMIIGIILVGFSTSFPEMLVSALAAVKGQPQLSIGSAIGSNIMNIGFAIGLVAILRPIMVHPIVLKREFLLLLASIAISAGLLLNGYLSRLDGIILLTLLILALTYLSLYPNHLKTPDFNGMSSSECKSKSFPNSGAITQSFKFNSAQAHYVKASASSSNLGIAKTAHHPSTTNSNNPTTKSKQSKISHAYCWLIFGLILLLAGAQLLVTHAVIIAKWLGLSDFVIGITIVALSTSLPEIAASVAGVLKQEDDIALGNVIGSNLFNLLGVLAMPALFHPTTINTQLLTRDYPVMTAITLLLYLMAWGFDKKHQINRIEGFILLSLTLGYSAWLIW